MSPPKKLKIWQTVYIAIGGSLILLFMLFTGRAYDTVGRTSHIFIKHQPTLKFNFYSPSVARDVPEEMLPHHLQEEERMYREFVYGRQKMAKPAFVLPFVVLQVGISFLMIGLYAMVWRPKRSSFLVKRKELTFLIVLMIGLVGVGLLLEHLSTPFHRSLSLRWKLLGILVVQFLVVAYLSTHKLRRKELRNKFDK